LPRSAQASSRSPARKEKLKRLLSGSAIKAKGIRAALVIPADIPLLRAADLESLCEQQPLAPSVLLVPSHDEMGTNALLPRRLMSCAPLRL
jgi:2-phospho-L-lactate guanylyltransferase (CobY/MobA/RfbA family)